MKNRTITLAGALGLLVSSCAGLPLATDGAAPVTAIQTPPTTLPFTELTTTTIPTTTTTTAPTTAPTTALTTTTTMTPTVPTTLFPQETGPVALLIGDSVLENLAWADTPFPFPVSYDTAVSRSIVQLPERLAAARELGPLPPYIVIHLGTNGWAEVYEPLFEQSLVDLSGYGVILVNVWADRVWTEGANAAITAAAERHQHVSLVDWRGTASPVLLRSDQIHPSELGREVLRDLILGELTERAATAPSPAPFLPPTTVAPPEPVAVDPVAPAPAATDTVAPADPAAPSDPAAPPDE